MLSLKSLSPKACPRHHARIYLGVRHYDGLCGGLGQGDAGMPCLFGLKLHAGALFTMYFYVAFQIIG